RRVPKSASLRLPLNPCGPHRPRRHERSTPGRCSGGATCLVSKLWGSKAARSRVMRASLQTRHVAPSERLLPGRSKRMRVSIAASRSLRVLRLLLSRGGSHRGPVDTALRDSERELRDSPGLGDSEELRRLAKSEGALLDSEGWASRLGGTGLR